MWGVHRSTSLMSSSLLLQQCPACLVRLTLIVFVMGGKWPYTCCFVGCYLYDLFNIARNILVLFPSSFFFIRLVSVHVVHLYSSIDTTAALDSDWYTSMWLMEIYEIWLKWFQNKISRQKNGKTYFRYDYEHCFWVCEIAATRVYVCVCRSY